MSRRMLALEGDNAGDKPIMEPGDTPVSTPATLYETSWEDFDFDPEALGSFSALGFYDPGPSFNDRSAKVVSELESSQMVASGAPVDPHIARLKMAGAISSNSNPPLDIIPDELSRFVEVSDLTAENHMEEQSRELLTTYIIVRFENLEPRNKPNSAGENASWVDCIRTRVPNVDNGRAREDIQRLNRMDIKGAKKGEGISVLKKQQSLNQHAQDQITRAARDLAMAEQDPRYHTILEQLDWTEGVYSKNSGRSRKHKSSSKKTLLEKPSITVYFSRRPRPGQIASELYRRFELNKYQQQEQSERQRHRFMIQISEEKDHQKEILSSMRRMYEKNTHRSNIHLEMLPEEKRAFSEYEYPGVDENVMTRGVDPATSKRDRSQPFAGNHVESPVHKDIQQVELSHDVQKYPGENYDYAMKTNLTGTRTTAKLQNLKSASREAKYAREQPPKSQFQQPADLESEDGGVIASSSISENTISTHVQSFSQMTGQRSTSPTSLSASSTSRWDTHEKKNRLPNPNAPPTVLYSLGTDIGIESVASLPDSIGSTDSNDSSHVQASVDYIVAKLTEDGVMLALYTEASKKLSKQRFINNNRRLMKGLYLDMCREPDQSTPIKEVAAFLRSRKNRNDISHGIFQAVVPNEKGNVFQRPHEKQYSRLDDYLREPDARGVFMPRIGMNADIGVDDSGDSEIGDNEENPVLDLITLQTAGADLVRSRAFSDYKHRFRLFLHPEFDVEHEDIQKRLMKNITALVNPVVESANTRSEDPMSTGKRGSAVVKIYKWINDAIWQPPKGAQRVWYLCNCGQYTYIDVEELIPGGAEAVRREIVENVAATNGQTHTPGQSAPYSSLPLSIPPQSHQHSGRPSQSPSSPALSNLPSLSYMNATSVAPNAIHNNLKFLLVCVEGRSSKTLAELRHLDVSDEQDDEIFIRRILEQYEEARRNHHWTMSLLVPAWIRRWQVVNHFQQIWSRAPAGVAQTASRILESPPVSFMLKGWSELASVAEAGLGAPLHILHEADFVRFQLFPHVAGKEPYPSNFEPDSWPSIPVDTLTQHRYIYKPRFHAKILTMNLGHMRQHLEALHPRPLHHRTGARPFWYTRVPKKLDEPLFWPPDTDEDVLGYGIRIKEKLNIVLVLCWALVGLVLTGVAVVLCAARTGDNSSAFGLGAYLVALLAIYIPLQYESWKRT